MSVLINAFNPLYVGKRIGKSFEKSPNSEDLKRFVDRIILAVAVISPLMTLPQVFKIWYYQSAAGVSLITWASYLIFAVVWFSYGIFHKNKPIIVSSFLWFIVKLMVVIGIVRYG